MPSSPSHASRSFLRRPSQLLLLALVPLAASCVTQARYDQMSTLATTYHNELLDRQQYQHQLEANNARLEGELALYKSKGPIEAGFVGDIDARLAELRALLAGMGQSSDDVSVFPVDGGVGYSMKDSILFDSGSDEIKPAGRELLLSMAKEFDKHAYRRIWVRGHTDSDRIAKPSSLERFPMGNLQLSAYRALRVADLLVKQAKLPEAKVCVQGLGPNEPLNANDSAAAKQRNRRVELYVLDADTSGGAAAENDSDKSSAAQVPAAGTSR
jgi:chemotaxis protein MotB